MKAVFPVCALLALTLTGHAADVSWTGGADDKWANPLNWDPANVPTSADVAIFGPTGANPAIDLPLPAYTLEGIDFTGGGYFLNGVTSETPTLITLTNGTLKSSGLEGSTNFVIATVRMTNATNTVTVTGGEGHELDLDDLEVPNGSLTTHIESSLCLGGTTTVSGAFVKTGAGDTCAGGGITAASTTIHNGSVTIEGDSSLGNVTVASAGTLVVAFGAEATAGSVESHGVVAISPGFEDLGVLTVTDGLTIKNEGALAGGGTVNGDVALEAGSTLASSNFFGDGLKINGDLTLAPGSTTLATIYDTDVLIGLYTVNGNLTVGGWLSLNDSGQPGLYTISQFTGSLSGAYEGVQDATPGYNYDFIYGPDSVKLSVTAIPEPSTIGLALLAGAGALAVRRRAGRK